MSESGEDKVLNWTCVTCYFATWLVVLSGGFKWPLLVPAVVFAGIYAGMHYYEMTVRGHLALSADSTAVPVTAVALGLGALAAHFSGLARDDILSFAWSAAIALVAGHLVVFAVVFLMDRLGLDKPRI
jgi:hypothetical protein